MTKISITDNEGVVVTGHLPLNWAEVPLSHYARLAQAATWPARCRALAELCGLPAQPLLDDVSLCLPILRAAPFLLDGPLPDTDAALPFFIHGGITYEFVGALHKISGEQYEALDAVLSGATADNKPVAGVAHELLAVLYKPLGEKQTADSVEQTAAAFASLPMSLGWPAIGFFLLQSAGSARVTRLYSELSAQIQQTIQVLEEAVAPSLTSSWSFRHWLIKAWLRRVKTSY